MICKATISQTATSDPKIKPKVFDGKKYCEITFDIYGVSVDALLDYCQKELNITIDKND